MLNWLLLLVTVFTLAGCASPKADLASVPAATRPLNIANILVGAFRGTVFDGEQHLPVVTTFRQKEDGTLVGSYVIDEPDGVLTGELNAYVDVWPEMFWCRFSWSDKHGTGIFSVMAMPDGSEFRGFWGEEIAHPQLKWTGKRIVDEAATRPAP